MPKKPSLIIEALLVLVLATAITRILIAIKSPALQPYSDIFISAVWLYLPIILLLAKRISFKDMALENLNLLKSLKWFAIASVVVFPIFYLAMWIGAVQIMGWKFKLLIPGSIWTLMLGQLLVVALPEEIFFRGYLQARFNQALAKKWNVFSAQIGPGLFITAALFALAHFAVRPTPDRLTVFFPALVFGWLREKTDSLLAPALFHFASNLGFIIFQISLSR